MVANESSLSSRGPRRQWPVAEKRRLVELTLKGDRSTRSIAREHGVDPACLHQWKARYRSGKLDGPPARRGRPPTTKASFVAVNVVSTVKSAQSQMASHIAVKGCIVRVVLASGNTLQVESSALDAALICALVAELRR